jgi:hypothetical protein
MTKISLAILLVCVATCAHAQTPWDKTRILPPPQYDKPYPGELKIYRVATEDDVRHLCLGDRPGRALACNLRWGEAKCLVFIVPDEMLATVGLSYAVTLRHEIGHCNGWPGYHPDARYVVDPFAQPVGVPFLQNVLRFPW